MKKATPRQIIYLIGIITLIIILASCNAERKAARQDEKAFNRYSGNIELIRRSVPIVKSLFPSEFEIVRSDTTFLPDSIPYVIFQDVPFEVLKYKNKVIDTLIGDYSLFVDSLGVQIKYLGKPQIVTKRIETWHIDTKEVDRLNDSLNTKEVDIANLKGKYSELEKRLNETESDKNRWATYFWLLVSVIAILIGTALFFKLKTKVPLP